jgi:putative sigma-54 modulation protein
MKVIYTGRHVEVTDALRLSTQERLDKMTTYLDDIIDVHVIFSVEKHRHQAEITLKTRRSDFIACAETDDMYASLSQALDKLEAQAHKQSGKQKAGIKTKAAHPDATAVEPAELETEETEG